MLSEMMLVYVDVISSFGIGLVSCNQYCAHVVYM